MHPSVRGAFDPVAPTYVDTASYGLPPRETVRALKSALAEWQSGSADWIADWDVAGEGCRALAGLVLGAPAGEVALLPAVSVGAAVAFSAVGAGDEILVPENEFTSLLYPALVAARRAGGVVRRVPFERLAEQVSSRTRVVATSHVRSDDGTVQDLVKVAAAARAAGALVVVDVTHSAGILPIEAERLGLDVVVCAAYKHLLCPRGVAFMRVAPEHSPRLDPLVASWCSAAPRYDHFYGGDLGDLAPDAARFDVSLCWHPWIGAQSSLALLCSIPVEERRAWAVGLADALAERLGIPRTGSSVVTVPVTDGEAARVALTEAGIVTSGRGPGVRVSFHLYNDASHVGRVEAVLGRFVSRA
jgi:selenocysteine lyase/cysteine desulfurase